jgi:hypothetical protein
MDDALPPEAETDEIDPAKKRIERRLAMLEELADIGMKLARANGEKALAKRAAEAEAQADRAAVKPPPAETPSKDDPSLAFERMARLVQQNLALQTRIEEGPRKCATARASGASATRERTAGKSGRAKVDQGRGDRLGVPVSQLTNAELDALITDGGDDEDWDDEEDEPSEEEAWRYWDNAEDSRDRAIARTRRELGLPPERIPAGSPAPEDGDAAAGQARSDEPIDDWAAGLRPVGKPCAVPSAPAPRPLGADTGCGPPITRQQ